MTSDEGGEADPGNIAPELGHEANIGEEEEPNRNINDGDSLGDLLRNSDDEEASDARSLDAATKAVLETELKAADLGNTLGLDAVSDFEVPIMGQLSRVNGKPVIISGGVPKVDWSGLKNPQSHRSPFQLRELFKVSSKDYKNRCEKLNTTVTKDTNLVVLGDTLIMKFQEIGVDTITYLPDPADSQNAISVLTDHAKFTKEEGTILSKQLSSKFDFMDWENNGAATAVLLNSLDTKLYEKLIKNRDSDDTFVITWLRLVDYLYPHSISTFEMYKNKIRKRRPTDYAGQDIEELCADFENDAKKCSYHFDHELTMVMLETIMTAGGDSNEDFKAELRPLKKKLDKALMSIRFMDATTKEKYLLREELTVSKVLEECESQYRYLKSRGKWYPALGVRDPNSPKVFVSQGSSSQTFNNEDVANVMALMANFPTSNSSKKKGNCNYCGKPGHWKADCPLLKLKKKSQDTSSSNINNSVPQKKSWRRTAPPSGSPQTISKNGRKYHWCQICKRWTETHGTAEHKVGYKKDSQTDNLNNHNGATASLAVDASIWFCSGSAPSYSGSRDFFIDLLGFCFGIIVFAHAFEMITSVLQVLIPILSIFKRDLFFLSLSPIVSLLFYLGAKWVVGPLKKEKKLSRIICRKHSQHVYREHRRHRKHSRKRRRYPRVGPVRRRGIYAARENAPTVLEQNVMQMMRDLRFELVRSHNRSHRSNSGMNTPNHCRHQARRRRNRRHSESMQVRTLNPDATLCMAVGDQESSESSVKQPSSLYRLLRAALQAPRRLLHAMKRDAPFPVIWDSGASHCVTYDKNDFISEIKDPGSLRQVKGINSALEVKGIGTVQWSMYNEKGEIRHFQLPALLVPKCQSKLLSTSALLRTYENEHLIQHASYMRLSGNHTHHERESVLIPLEKQSGLLKATMFRSSGAEEAVACLGETISSVRSVNLNLSESEKELLKWHYRLGHLSFRRIQALLRTGVFSHSEASRLLHRSACRIRHPPKCAACLYGKQSARPLPRTSNTIVRDVGGGILDGDLQPGQRASVDHFICSVKGRRLNSAGKTKEEKMYSGGIVFVDHASDFVFVDYCMSPNSHESLRSKDKYESFCRDVGVVPQSYLTDNGSAFTSKAFTDSLANFHQTSSYSGVGAHHSNGKAENSIKRIMAIARTMMIHSAIHWPDVADSTLWPLAVEYATYLHNHVPQTSNGLSPIDTFTRTRHPTRRLLDLRVWGSPTYVLNKVISDGKKLPRWKPRSSRRMFVGLSKQHSTKAPLVLNLETGFISPQFHVVHDDFFATVSSSSDSTPDFTSDIWKNLFGSATHYLSEEIDNESPRSEDVIAQSRVQLRSDEIASRFDMQTPASELQVPPLATTQLQSEEDNEFVHVRNPSLVQQDNPSDYVIIDPPDSIESKKQSTRKVQKPDGERFGPEGASRNVQQIEDSNSTSSTHRKIQSEGGTPHSQLDTFTDLDSNLQEEISSETPIIKKSRNDRSENIQLNFPDSNVSDRSPSRPKRTSRPVSRFSDEYDRYYTLQPDFDSIDNSTAYVYVSTSRGSDDFTFEDILALPDRDQWILAAIYEINGLIEKETWIEEEQSLATSKILPGTWTFKLKRKPDGSIKKYKARYCVRGDLQDTREETHAPVCNFSSVRIFLVLSLLLGWITCTIDFTNAFVQAVLSSPVWIHLPRGFRSSRGRSTCLRLKKSLYGLRTAPRLWYEHLRHAMLEKLGFKQSAFDPCMFYRHNMLAILYVDDVGLAFPTEDVLDEFLNELQDLGFEFTREGTFSEFLGIQFNFDTIARSVTMTQSGLIDKILSTAGMSECKPNKLPTSQLPLGNDENGEMMVERWSYSSLVGMLLYLSTHTRPDVSFAVSQVARFSHKPKKSHANAMKHLLRYLKGTRTQGITFQLPDEPLKSMTSLLIEDYVDSDFAGLYRVECPHSMISAKSRTGYIIFLCGCPLIWKSQLQTGVALSTQEAEYTALSQSVRALIPIRHLVEEALKHLDLGPRLKIPQVICVAFEDNNGALSLATNHRLTSRTKYYHVNSHWFWGHVKDGKLHVKGISSNQQKADYLTKPLPFAPFGNNRKRVQGF